MAAVILWMTTGSTALRGADIRLIGREVRPDPEMSDGYFVDQPAGVEPPVSTDRTCRRIATEVLSVGGGMLRRRPSLVITRLVLAATVRNPGHFQARCHATRANATFLVKILH